MRTFGGETAPNPAFPTSPLLVITELALMREAVQEYIPVRTAPVQCTDLDVGRTRMDTRPLASLLAETPGQKRTDFGWATFLTGLRSFSTISMVYEHQDRVRRRLELTLGPARVATRQSDATPSLSVCTTWEKTADGPRFSDADIQVRTSLGGTAWAGLTEPELHGVVRGEGDVRAENIARKMAAVLHPINAALAKHRSPFM